MYGATFFEARGQPPAGVFFAQEFDSSVYLAVNEWGFHVIDRRDLSVLSYFWEEVKDWSSKGDRLFVDARKKNVPGAPAGTQRYQTPQAELINALLGDWRHEWEHPDHPKAPPAAILPLSTSGKFRSQQKIEKQKR